MRLPPSVLGLRTAPKIISKKHPVRKLLPGRGSKQRGEPLRFHRKFVAATAAFRILSGTAPTA